MARLSGSGSGLVPSGGRIGSALGLPVWSSKHEEKSEFVESEMPERKVLKEPSQLRMTGPEKLIIDLKFENLNLAHEFQLSDFKSKL